MRVGRRRFPVLALGRTEDEAFKKDQCRAPKSRFGNKKSPDPHQETGLWVKCAPKEVHFVDTYTHLNLTSFFIS